jgi:hypothetical protein
MRSRRQEKQSTRRRQEQEYRDKVLTLNKANYSELEAPIETRQLVPVERSKPILAAPKQLLDAPKELLRGVVPKAPPRSNLPLIILAYCLGIVGLGINAWFAWNRGSTLPDKVLLSSVGFLSEAIMFYLPAEASSLWTQRRYGGVGFACIVYVFVFAFALINSLGFASLNLSETATASRLLKKALAADQRP